MPPEIDLDTAKLDEVMGTKGRANGGVYQFSIASSRSDHREDGAMLPQRWALLIVLIFSRIARLRSPGDLSSLQRSLPPFSARTTT